MDWIITILGTVVGSIFFGVLGNLLTDPIKDWLSKRSLISKRKKVGELKSELEKTTLSFNDKGNFHFEVIMDSIVSSLFLIAGISAGICGTVFFILGNVNTAILFTETQPHISLLNLESPVYRAMVVGFLFGLIGYLFMAAGFSFAIALYNKVKRVKNFAKYKDEIEKRILELSEIKPKK